MVEEGLRVFDLLVTRTVARTLHKIHRLFDRLVTRTVAQTLHEFHWLVRWTVALTLAPLTVARTVLAAPSQRVVMMKTSVLQVQVSNRHPTPMQVYKWKSPTRR